MIYCPLSALMLAGIREILIITTPEDQATFQRLLGDGSAVGCDFQFAIQEAPNGLAEALLIDKDFVGDDKVALVPGDNSFFGQDFGDQLAEHTDIDGAAVFADPSARGELEITTINPALPRGRQAAGRDEGPMDGVAGHTVFALAYYLTRLISR